MKTNSKQLFSYLTSMDSYLSTVRLFMWFIIVDQTFLLSLVIVQDALLLHKLHVSCTECSTIRRVLAVCSLASASAPLDDDDIGKSG